MREKYAARSKAKEEAKEGGVLELGVLSIKGAESGKAGGELELTVEEGSNFGQGEGQGQGQGEGQEGGAGFFNFFYIFGGEPDTATHSSESPDAAADSSPEELLSPASVESRENEAISRAMSRVLKSMSESSPTPEHIEMTHSQINDVLAVLTRKCGRMSVTLAEK